MDDEAPGQRHAEGYLMKPVGVHEMAATIRQVLDP